MPGTSLCGYLPPAFSMSFIVDAFWGLSRWGLVQSLPSRDRGASDQGPSNCTALTGSSLDGAPQCVNRPTTHIPQPMLQQVRRLRASLALYGL